MYKTYMGNQQWARLFDDFQHKVHAEGPDFGTTVDAPLVQKERQDDGEGGTGVVVGGHGGVGHAHG